MVGPSAPMQSEADAFRTYRCTRGARALTAARRRNRRRSTADRHDNNNTSNRRSIQ